MSTFPCPHCNRSGDAYKCEDATGTHRRESTESEETRSPELHEVKPGQKWFVDGVRQVRHVWPDGLIGWTDGSLSPMKHLKMMDRLVDSAPVTESMGMGEPEATPAPYRQPGHLESTEKLQAIRSLCQSHNSPASNTSAHKLAGEVLRIIEGGELPNGWPGSETQNINGLFLVMTCPSCPEQYDVFNEHCEQVAYFRFRDGVLRVDVPKCGGREVFRADHDDSFLSQELLEQAVNAVLDCGDG